MTKSTENRGYESGNSPPDTASNTPHPVSLTPQRRSAPARNLAHLSSITDEWQTPLVYLDSVRQALGEIDLDPAAGDAENKRRVGAKVAYDINDDGLAQDWKGRTFLNPPYGRLAKRFVEKLLFHVGAGDVESAVVLLALPHMSTKSFQPLYAAASAFCITDHRIKFEPMAGQKAHSPTSGSVFVYIGDSPEDFAKAFDKHGAILRIYSVDGEVSGTWG